MYIHTQKRPAWLGQVLLAKALADRGHNVHDAETNAGTGQGTISRLLDGTRRAGMDVAAKVALAYPEVAIDSWTQEAPEGSEMVPIPRGKGRKTERDSDATGAT